MIIVNKYQKRIGNADTQLLNIQKAIFNILKLSNLLINVLVNNYNINNN